MRSEVKGKGRAKESVQVDKIRSKIKDQIAEQNSLTSQEALRKSAREIYDWLNRNASERVSLKDKSVVIFDKNQHPAQQSRYIKKMLHQLQKTTATKSGRELSSRVSRG